MVRRLVPLTGDIWLTELITKYQITKFLERKNLQSLGTETGQNNIRNSNNFKDTRPSETFATCHVMNVNSLRPSCKLKKQTE